MCWGSRGAAWRWEQTEAPTREPRVSPPSDVTGDTRSADTRSTLRIGDAERGQTAEVLKRHCTEGRLTLDEYSDRLDEVFAARTYEDLTRSLRDLPDMRPAAAGRGPARAPVDFGRVPGYLKVAAVILVVWALGSGGFFPAWPLIIVGICLVRRTRRSGPHHLEPPPPQRDQEIRV